MTDLTLTSPSNPIIKMARSLKQKKARDESGLFLAEGILHVGGAVEAGWEVDTLLYCPEYLKSEFGHALVENLRQRQVRCAAVSAAAFESFAEKQNPQGIAALVRQKALTLADFPAFSLAVALVSPQDPGNVGTILRTIDAVGADGLLLLDGGADPYHPSTVRASMGAVFWKPFVSTSFAQFGVWARQGGWRILGTSAHASADYRHLEQTHQPVILLLGSEQKGLSREQLSICDATLSLPMRGRATSLNLAVAAGVFLYALTSK